MVERGQDGAKRDVQRRREVVGLVHRTKPIEDQTEHAAASRGALEGKAQRKEQEECTRDHNGQGDLSREPEALVVARAQKGRENEKRIDRHVGHDHQWHERHVPLPGERDRPDVAAQASQGVAPAVDNQEQERERRRRECGADESGAGHDAVWRPFVRRVTYRRTATETVKMPHGSISMEIFSKPTERTSSSISACVRRRMIQGWPSRLRRTRAMNSTWGCHGWPV